MSEEKQKPSLFIPAQVDDYGFSAAELRIVCHISRRGWCWAATDNIAATCRLEPKTVRRAIKFLEAQDVVVVLRVPGRTNQISLRPLDEWKPHPYQKALGVQPLPKGTRRPYQKATGGTTERHKGGSTQKAPDKGSPSEGSPSEGNTTKGEAPQVLKLNRGETKLFPKEIKIQIDEIKDQIRAIKNRGSFDGVIRPEDWEEFQQLKDLLATKERELIGLPPKPKRANKRNASISGDAAERTRRIVDTIKRREAEAKTVNTESDSPKRETSVPGPDIKTIKEGWAKVRAEMAKPLTMEEAIG